MLANLRIPFLRRNQSGLHRHWRHRGSRSVAASVLAIFCLNRAAAAESPLVRAADRIVFVGDSITGQGWNQTQGFIHQIGTALAHEEPALAPALVALGGSGQGVNSWTSVESRSRDTESTLDVKEFPVKVNLDQPAGVIVIMLGMNDLIAPYVSARPEAVAAWSEQYRKLLRALRQRAAPGVLALATIPPATEDPVSPKNQVRDLLNAALRELAAAEECHVLPVGETIMATLSQGRRLDPAFRVTGDYVHPNAAGHAAIALGMLRGLGAERAAAWQEKSVLAPILARVAGEPPSLSCAIAPQEPVTLPPTFAVRYWLTPGSAAPGLTPNVTLAVPPGWSVTPANATAAEGRFAVTGDPAQWLNRLTLTATVGPVTRTRSIALPTPWLVGTGLVFAGVWPGNKQYVPDTSRPAFEAALTRGEGIGLPQTDGKRQLAWKRFYPSVDFVGGADPASLDGWGCDFGETFAGLYAARWVNSPRERAVTLCLRSATFAGKIGVAAWLNGERLYQGELTAEPKKSAQADGRLRQGWNLLLVRCDHLTWQWQMAATLAPVGDDNLDDLRYATTSPPGVK